MLQLSPRPAKFGPSFNGRSEKQGDDSDLAIDIALSDIALDKQELGEFDENLPGALYNGGDIPRLAKFKPLEMAEKIEGATVQLIDGTEMLELTDCKLAKLRFTALAGGKAMLAVQVQHHPKAEEMDWIGQRLRHPISVALAVQGYNEQADIED